MGKEVKENKAKDTLKTIGSVILRMGVGAIIGLSFVVIIDRCYSGIFKGDIFTIILCFALFIVAFMLQLILHELGHLICGLWSGYEFVSFRVGTLTFVKENGKIVRKKFNVMGTGGQCLMMPPEGNGYDCPYFLYNLGGVLMNTVVSCLCVAAYLLLPMPKIAGAFVLFIAISGFYDLIMNGIPMKISGIANDGYNMMSLGKDKLARYTFYIQLRVNGLLYQGIRIKDMPVKWFELPDGADLNNPMISSVKFLEGCYYHDRKEFDKVRECYENLLKDASKLHKLYENEIKCELLFYEIIGEGRQDVIEELYTKDLKKYIKATNCYITRKRLMYAYALIIEKDAAKADKILNEVDVVKKTYPAKAEVESELEIIDFIKQRHVHNIKETLEIKE